MGSNHPAHLPPAPEWPIHPAMLSTTDQIPGFNICQSIALVHGVHVLTGGTSLFESTSAKFEQAISQAILSMLQDAARYGANAIVGIRYTFSDSQLCVRILVSGTYFVAGKVDE